ncbi:MAG: hypothetical protein V7643_4888 [Mycobacterium sp.]
MGRLFEILHRRLTDLPWLPPRSDTPRRNDSLCRAELAISTRTVAIRNIRYCRMSVHIRLGARPELISPGGHRMPYGVWSAVTSWVLPLIAAVVGRCQVAEQTGQFLDHVVHHRLYPLFLLVAHRGLRRGEACGARWPDTNLDAGHMYVRNQIVQYGWETGMSRPKTTSSEGLVALDADLILVLRALKVRQVQERDEAGDAWVETGGLMFTEPDGSALHPSDVTDVFQFLAAQAGLPPIRLHDLRHGAATLALAAGVDMKVVQEMLRHSSITVTSDTYTSVLTEVARDAAEKTAMIIPRTRPGTLGLPSGQQETTVDGEQMVREYQKGQVNVDVDLPFGGAPPGTRTPNPLVKSRHPDLSGGAE